MKNAELIALLISNTNKTANIRTYGKRWFSGARRISDKVATKVGKMVALMQEKIDSGELIDGTTQSLLIYNFQPLYADTNAAYITFDMLIKPLEEIHDTHDLEGIPIQVVVDVISCEMMNNARAMLQMGVADSDPQDPIYYGNYNNYNAVCSFITLRHSEQLDADDVFACKYDSLPPLQQSLAFDSFIEARDYLECNWDEYCMVAEVNYPKEEHPAILESRCIGNHMIKLIHPHKPSVEVSNNLTTEPKEDRVDDEVNRLLDATLEPPAVADFCTVNA